MQIGDLVRYLIYAKGQMQPSIGIVTYQFSNLDVFVLFADGEYQMDPVDLEVINAEYY